jgi:hypothetical protein
MYDVADVDPKLEDVSEAPHLEPLHSDMQPSAHNQSITAYDVSAHSPVSNVTLGIPSEIRTCGSFIETSNPGAAVPKSPASNRDRFRQGFLPSRTCCNLDLCRSPAGTKFTLTAVCIAVFPAQVGPDRRYLQLADVTGTVGVTVWNHNVAKFSSSSVGQVVTLNKATITNHQGKKSLTLARDSSVEIGTDTQHSAFTWWQEILLLCPLTCGGVHDISDNTMINVSGIVGHVSSETKIVNNAEKTLTSIHLVDSTGRLDIRSWNHGPDCFLQYVDRPIIIKRVRVTSFAGTKLAEFLDGSGSVIETSFPGAAALLKFWAQ